jgi:transposase
MSKERIVMRKIREILRLHFENKLSINQISEVCSIARSTVQEYLRRFNTSKLPWPLPTDLTDELLEKQLYPPKPNALQQDRGLDYNYFLQELRRPNVTKEVLWSEYKQANPGGYQYSYFCDLLRQAAKKSKYSMRQIHKGGEKVFVDFGKGLNFIAPDTGEVIPTQLYVSCWGASNYLFAQAVLKEDLVSWISAHVAALNYFGCCPKAIIPDNLKAAVTKACRYEPELNPTYLEFAQHYGTTVLPARPHHPKDKAKVETGVKLGKRWILARLRNHKFTSLAQLNDAISELLEQFNNRIMKAVGQNRKTMFTQLDLPNALPLPEKPYEYADWKWASVNINYHVQYDHHDYSVPYTTGCGQRVGIRATGSTIEIYANVHKQSQRIASHTRSYRKHGYTTKNEHMPASHRKFLEWTPERIISWAQKCGPAVKALVEAMLKRKVHPEQSYKSCLGIIRLTNHYSHTKLNLACQRALQFRVFSYKGIKNILSKHLESLNTTTKPVYRSQHENIRGADYFANHDQINLKLIN